MEKNKSDAVIQMSLFDVDNSAIERKTTANYYNKLPAQLNPEDYEKFDSYKLETYIDDVTADGLEKTWDKLCAYVLEKGEGKFLNISNFGEMYEIGLAIQDKIQKKKSGQYYTPDDVALVMSGWLEQCDGENVCDVACGTGCMFVQSVEFTNNRGGQRGNDLKISMKKLLMNYKRNEGRIRWIGY